MSTFNFNTNSNANIVTVSFYLNLAKRQDNRETVIGFCHNGMLICSPKNDTSWLQFSINSDKQGWVPMELNYQGQTKKIDPEAFWSKLFSCESEDEIPNVNIKLDLGDIDTAEEMYSQGGCLKVTIDIENISLLGEKEYNNESSLYLRVTPIDLSLVAYYGVVLSGAWVKQCLSESIVEDTNSSNLARFKRSRKKEQKRLEVETAKANSPKIEGSDSDLDSEESEETNPLLSL